MIVLVHKICRGFLILSYSRDWDLLYCGKCDKFVKIANDSVEQVDDGNVDEISTIFK